MLRLWRAPMTALPVRRAGGTPSMASLHSSPRLLSSAADNPASRPYARHRPALPQPASYRLTAVLFVLFSIGSWAAFTLHATNRERLSSSVLKNVMEKIKDDERVQSRMGDGVALEREMLLAGDPWINGNVNMMQGRVDMSFRVKGSKDSGKAYFTSIRRDQTQPYETLRFLIVLDSNKEAISLLDD